MRGPWEPVAEKAEKQQYGSRKYHHFQKNYQIDPLSCENFFPMNFRRSIPRTSILIDPIVEDKVSMVSVNTEGRGSWVKNSRIPTAMAIRLILERIFFQFIPLLSFMRDWPCVQRQ